MDKIKPYLPIILPVLAGIALFIFWDYALEIVLGLFGLGAVAIKTQKTKSERAATIADEHENLADARIIQSINELKQAETAHDKAVEIAEKDDTTPIPVKAGGVRRSFKSQ